MKGTMREKRRGVWELRVALGRDPYTRKVLQKSETFHGGKRAAEDRLRDMVAKAQQGGFGGRNTTVATTLDSWLEHRRALGRSPTTLTNYASKMKTINGSPLGPIPLSKLRAEHINGFYRERLRTNSPTTVHHFHRILSGALRFAERQGWINWMGPSPAERAEPPTPDRHEQYEPTVEDLHRLIAAAEKSRQPEMATAMRIAAPIGIGGPSPFVGASTR
jgi:hypothetical protein